MLNTLQFNMSLPTQYPFLKRFLKAAQADKKVYEFTNYLLSTETALLTYQTLCTMFKKSLGRH